jgi:hypothetical protein
MSSKWRLTVCNVVFSGIFYWSVGCSVFFLVRLFGSDAQLIDLGQFCYSVGSDCADDLRIASAKQKT